MDVPMALRTVFDEGVWPDDYGVWFIADGTINEEVGIVAYGLKKFTEFSYDVVKDFIDMPEGHIYEGVLEYVLCRKRDHILSDWEDYKYDGYRIVLHGFFLEGGWEKKFLDGHSETLVWGYLYKGNAQDVVDLISYWPGMLEVTEFVKKKFEL